MLDKMRPRRLIIVDPDGEYDGWGELTDDPVRVLQHLALPEYRVRFRPSHDRKTAEKQFALVCAAARWQVDPQPHQAKPASSAAIVFLVDELADVCGGAAESQTSAEWSWLYKHGRKFGVMTLAASQRPEDVNKGIFDCASLIRVGRLNNLAGQRRVAASIGVKAERIQALSGTQFLARDKRTGELTEGGEPAKTGVFSAGRPTE